MAVEKKRILPEMINSEFVERNEVTQFRFFGIGIDSYLNMESLDYPCQEVLALEKLLVETYGFRASATLLNEEASRENMEQKLYEICKYGREDEAILIYFAGHGYYDDQFQKRGYWIPYDGGRLNDEPPVNSYIPNVQIAGWIQASPAKHILLIVDSCFSGSLFLEYEKSRSIKVPGRARYPSRYAISSGLIEPVRDKSDFFISLYSILEKNEAPFLGASTLFSKISEKMGGLNVAQTPAGGNLRCDLENAIGEFSFFRSEPIVEKRFRRWKFPSRILWYAHLLPLIVGFIFLIGLFIVEINAPYWIRIAVISGVVLASNVFLSAEGFAPVIFRGRGLAGRFRGKKWRRKNGIVAYLGLLHLTFALFTGYALLGYQTVEVKWGGLVHERHQLYGDGKGVFLTFAPTSPRQDTFEVKIRFGENYRRRFEMGGYLVSAKFAEKSFAEKSHSVFFGSMVAIQPGYRPVEIEI